MQKICTLFLCLCLAVAAKAQTDTTIGLQVPRSASRNTVKLAHALCDSLDTDHRKVNAIYNWVTHNIRYDVKALQRGKLGDVSTKKVLKKRRALCEGYAQLINDLCKEVNIPSVMVDGYAKDWMFDNGDKFYIPRHAWNAVFVDYEWQLIDATWGAGGVGQSPGLLKRLTNKISGNKMNYSGKMKFRFDYDAAFFLQDPAAFRMRHLPTDPLWQLSDTAMPLAVFEAGEEAITGFNKAYSGTHKSALELNQYARMSQHEKVLFSSDRSFAFNPRFSTGMAAKHQALAIEAVRKQKEQLITDGMNVVSNEVKTSEGFLAAQIKDVSKEYRELKKKNKTKHQAAKQYIASIHTANKRMISQCESVIKGAESRNTGAERKAGSYVHNNPTPAAGGLRKISTIATEQPATTPELQVLEDSVNARMQRIAALEADAALQNTGISALKQLHQKRLDTLAGSLSLADSALVGETIARIHMNDNYDDPVIKWNTIVKQVKLKDVDSQQRYFKASYDTVLVHYESLRKTLQANAGMYKKSFKDLEQYKRRNQSNTALLAKYDQLQAQHTQLTKDYIRVLSEQVGFVTANKKLYTQLVKFYKRQEKLAKYMEDAEKHRKELEETSLTKKEAFDKKENEAQKQQLKQTTRKAEKILS